MTPAQIEFYKRLAHGLVLQFGPNCEVVVHDLETEDVDHSIVVIENGHVSGRKLGDGPSHIVFESMHEGATASRTSLKPPTVSCSNRRRSLSATTRASPSAFWASTLTLRL